MSGVRGDGDYGHTSMGCMPCSMCSRRKSRHLDAKATMRKEHLPHHEEAAQTTNVFSAKPDEQK